MQKRILCGWTACWLCGAAASFAQAYVEAGPWFRGDMEISVTGGSHAANEEMLAAAPGTRGGTAWVDPIVLNDDGSAQILRTFTDGYVGPSGWAWAQPLGVSQYFAYQNASQYDAAANTLTFTVSQSASDTRRRTITTVTSGAAGWSGTQNLDGAGALVTAGYTFSASALFDISFQIQAGWLDGVDASFMDQTAWTQQVEWTTIESTMTREASWNFVYDTLGNPFFPTAPYEMTDPSGVGPLISDRPVSINETAGGGSWDERVVNRRQASAFSRVGLDMEGQAFMFSLGPRITFHPIDRLSLLVQGGPTLNLLDAELTRTETFAWEDGTVLGMWADRKCEQEWLWGATLSAGLRFDVTPNLYLQGAGGYDWVESCNLSVGPDRVHVDLSGYRAEVALGWRFGR